MDVPSNLRELFKAGLSSDILVLCLPHIIVHSAGIRSSPIIQDIPVRILEGSLVGKEIISFFFFFFMYFGNLVFYISKIWNEIQWN